MITRLKKLYFLIGQCSCSIWLKLDNKRNPVQTLSRISTKSVQETNKINQKLQQHSRISNDGLGSRPIHTDQSKHRKVRKNIEPVKNKATRGHTQPKGKERNKLRTDE